MEIESIEIEIIGVRPGEKIHETLLTSEEKFRCIEHQDYFQVPSIDSRDTSTYNMQLLNGVEYSSNTTEQLTQESLAELLARIPLISELLMQS